MATTTGGLPSALDAADTLVGAAVEPTEFSLRPPSLEEAFLALTDAPTDQPTPTPTRSVAPAARADTARPSPDRPDATSPRSSAASWNDSLRSPQSLFFAAVMPVMFVLGLTAVFGDLVETVLGDDYIHFLLPGVLVMQITLAAGTTGVGIATDLRDGIIDRFRSLPIAQPPCSSAAPPPISPATRSAPRS